MTVAVDGIGELCSIDGLGNIFLGGALGGAQSFSSVYADGVASIPVKVELLDSNYAVIAWERVRCTYLSAGNQLVRGAVMASSNAGNPVNFPAGTKRVFVYLPVADVAADLTAGLAGKANTSHTQAASTISDSTTVGRNLLTASDEFDQRQLLGLGNGAILNAPLVGDASSSQLLKGNDSRLIDDRTASGIRSATTVVSVSAGAAPSTGQVLTATGSAAATWQTPGGGMAIGGAVTGGTAGRILFTGAGPALADSANYRIDGDFLVLNGGYFRQYQTGVNIGHANVNGDVLFVGDQGYNKVSMGANAVLGWSDINCGNPNIATYLQTGFYRIAQGQIGCGQGSLTDSLAAAKLRTQTYTLAALNSAFPSPSVGDRAFVTDETTGTFGATSVGGGSLERPVFYGNGGWKNG